MAHTGYNECTFADVQPDKKKAGPSRLYLTMLLALFVLNRALHPLVIDLSKAPVPEKPSHTNGPIEVGTRVGLRGTGKHRSWWNQYFADVVEASNETIKVRYIEGGYKRFTVNEFKRNLAKIPKADGDEYEVGTRVRLYGIGKWWASSQTFDADVVDISRGTVKVRYTDGSFKRFQKPDFEKDLAPRSKKEPKSAILYGKLSPVLVKSFLCLFCCNFCALFAKDGWKAGLLRCYTGPSMKIYTFIGGVYAVGDLLEMASMGGMDGAAYQVLLQSKLVITALMLWAIKGDSAKQTLTQWTSLTTLSIGMVIFMVTDSGSGSGSGNQGASLMASMFAILKVLFSCYGAVIADTTLKQYKNLPLYASLNQLFFSWTYFAIILAFLFEPAAMSSPEAFFEGWNYGTVLTTISFSVKTVLTMTILKVLDSIQKTIGEAVAVMVIYLFQILMPSFHKHFQAQTFLAMLSVVMTVSTYMFLSDDTEKFKALARASSDTSIKGSKSSKGP